MTAVSSPFFVLEPSRAAPTDVVGVAALSDAELNAKIATAAHIPLFVGSQEYADASAYQQALRAEKADRERAMESVADKCLRIEREAEGLDASSERLFRQSADQYGRAAYRKSKGADDWQALQRSAKALEDTAADYMEQAFKLRLEIAQIKLRADVGAALMAVVSPASLSIQSA